MTAAAWIGDHWNWTPRPEPERETVTGVPYTVDWTRRRILAVGEGKSHLRCWHGGMLISWCHDCETDLDALAAHTL